MCVCRPLSAEEAGGSTRNVAGSCSTYRQPGAPANGRPPSRTSAACVTEHAALEAQVAQSPSARIRCRSFRAQGAGAARGWRSASGQGLSWMTNTESFFASLAQDFARAEIRQGRRAAPGSHKILTRGFLRAFVLRECIASLLLCLRQFCS